MASTNSNNPQNNVQDAKSGPTALVIIDSSQPNGRTGPAGVLAEGVDAQRIGRFQALEPGTYWRCTKGNEDFKKYLVLLLLDIEMFDGKPHTIVLRSHPLQGRVSNYKILLDDFLNRWEFAIDGEEVRARELSGLQSEIVQSQADLMSSQEDQSMVAPFIRESLLKWEKSVISRNEDEQQRNDRQAKERQTKDAEGDGLAKRVVTLPSTSTSVSSNGLNAQPSAERAMAMTQSNGRIRTDLFSVMENRLSADDVKQLSLTVERQAVIAEAKAKFLESKVRVITSKVEAMAPFFAEKTAVALARTKGIQDYAKELMKGIQTLSLYTGVGVEVFTLTEGADASEEIPLTLMQRKLFMDEELAAHIDVDEVFDHTSIDVFEKVLARDPSLRDRIFPTERCVVSMAVRRSAIDYGDLYSNMNRNEANMNVFLLVRNGENIHRVHSAEESHEKTPRLFPTKSDVDKPFRGYDGSQINFNDLRFTDAAKKAKDLSLHYKRLLVLLCGLDHRMGLFGPFHSLGSSLSFISMDFQAKHMRFVADDEPDFALGEGRPSVGQWLAARNAYLQSGSRVLCYHPSLINDKTAPSCERRDSGSYTTVLADPLKESEILVAYRDGKEVCVDARVSRAKRTWRDITQVEFNARISLTEAQKQGDMAFVCLDDVKPSDLLWYVNSRENRVQHIDFIRMFKRTAAILQEQALREAPAVNYIKNAVSQGGFCEPGQAKEVVGNAIRGWRCANRGADLPGISDTKAFEAILNLAHSLTREDDFSVMLEKYALSNDLAPLKSVLTGKNRLALYVEVPPAQRDERLMPWRWAKRLSIEVLKNRLNVTSEKMIWLDGKPDAKETELKTWPALETWINKKPVPATPHQMTAACSLVERGIENHQNWFTGKGEGIAEDVFERLLKNMVSLIRGDGAKIKDVRIDLPIATFISPSDSRQEQPELKFLTVSADAYLWLHHFASPEQAEQITREYVRIFVAKDSALKRVKAEFAPTLNVRSKLDELDWLPELHMGTHKYVPEGSISFALHDSRIENESSRVSFWNRENPINRSLDSAVAFWLRDVQPTGKQWDKYRPGQVFMSADLEAQLLGLPQGVDDASGPLAQLMGLAERPKNKMKMTPTP